MKLDNSYQTLLRSGRPTNRPLELTAPAEAVCEIIAYGEECGILPTSHPWELAPSARRDLELRTGTAPPGGWGRLAGLAAGAGVLHATSDGFTPITSCERVAGSPDGFRRALIEAFTVRLVPPAAAAALYVALDVHPVWGLRLGHETGVCHAVDFDSNPGALRAVQEIVFGTIAAFVAALRGLDPGCCYPIDALGDVLFSAAAGIRAGEESDASSASLPVFLASVDDRREVTARMAVVDLLDLVFVPAGVVHVDATQSVRCDPDALAEVDIGPFGGSLYDDWCARLDDAAGLCRPKAS